MTRHAADVVFGLFLPCRHPYGCASVEFSVKMSTYFARMRDLILIPVLLTADPPSLPHSASCIDSNAVQGVVC